MILADPSLIDVFMDCIERAERLKLRKNEKEDDGHSHTPNSNQNVEGIGSSSSLSSFPSNTILLHDEEIPILNNQDHIEEGKWKEGEGEGGGGGRNGNHNHLLSGEGDLVYHHEEIQMEQKLNEGFIWRREEEGRI